MDCHADKSARNDRGVVDCHDFAAASLAMTDKMSFFTTAVLLQHDSKHCGGAVGVFYKFSKETCCGFALHRCRWFWVGVTLAVMTAQNL